MSKVNTVWVCADRLEDIASLAAGAKTIGEKIVAVVYENEDAARQASAIGPDEALFFSMPEGVRVEDCVDDIFFKVQDDAPDLILFDKSTRGRFLAAALAAKLGQASLHNAMELEMSSEGVVVSQMVYGGAAVRKVTSQASTTVVIVGPGTFSEEPQPSEGTVRKVDVTPTTSPIVLLETKKRDVAAVNLAEAKKVVAIGRGVSTEEDVQAVREFAELIGAEMGCTRPVSESLGLMETERYIGVSGVMFKPEVFISIGASGQVQHMVGCNKSGTIFSINKDKAAPIFKQSDYGLVADFKTVVPKLVEMLS